MQWLPPIPGISIQSAYAENPDPLISRRLHGLHSQLAAFWFQGSSGLPANEPSSPSTVLTLQENPPCGIIILRASKDYLDHFTYLTHSQSFHPPPHIPPL
ncbi:hypothetical protein CRENBAI_016909 [Crenichthys baileyi]|uniref:Uncharacterized protein n=1 Tax=Crenichthys baileyi TaxID=28760 RepID=A0AAV9RQW0_9TELE